MSEDEGGGRGSIYLELEQQQQLGRDRCVTTRTVQQRKHGLKESETDIMAYVFVGSSSCGRRYNYSNLTS